MAARWELLNKFIQDGFLFHPHKEHFGCEIPYVDYLYKHATNHIYVSVISYDFQVVEIVYEEYLVKKNTRIKGKDSKSDKEQYSHFQKMGFHPIEIKLIRGEGLVCLNQK